MPATTQTPPKAASDVRTNQFAADDKAGDTRDDGASANCDKLAVVVIPHDNICTDEGTGGSAVSLSFCWRGL